MSETRRQRVEFDHVGLNVADLDEATGWYCNTFGLTAAKPFEIPATGLRGVMLLHEPSGYRIELLSRPGARPGMLPASPDEAPLTLGYGHICLRVQHVHAEYARLVEAGCSSRKEPSPGPRPGAFMSYVADPWGNLIEVINRD
ncbi:catechol 2,3-dioxygenase-like lactoylglutathione lyase family enzyme [Amycolatopsis bartoniae]|uniref:VOC domain-containing protein n=1 Tax=Amycolatopsis bartoniae TaxID=941986 RepID=A0A8H9IVI9_9PSEU|nr:VOC family protein [Amycolatopsis bartoniae]MBB2940254.1 catechol 2,3-dioxygenase-like lactoylglutathione lyase family enzyme [Amycolatopsis bartoniae]TVT10166.1 VOC family protein [Amycolatopsis bartoniae]GHF35200.1 hypothetical protein GCM10017566_04910 [Amycolatopsis bartoniae]